MSRLKARCHGGGPSSDRTVCVDGPSRAEFSEHRRINHSFATDTMTAPAAGSQYMLLFRGLHWDEDLSPEEIGKVMVKWDAWFDRLVQESKAIIGPPPTYEVKIH